MNPIDQTQPEEKAYCEKHLTSRPGKDQFGNWYSQCFTGHTLNEECKIVVVKEGEENE